MDQQSMLSPTPRHFSISSKHSEIEVFTTKDGIVLDVFPTSTAVCQATAALTLAEAARLITALSDAVRASAAAADFDPRQISLLPIRRVA